jgi:hypothetical protein
MSMHVESPTFVEPIQLVSGFGGSVYYSTSLVLNSLRSKVYLFSLTQKHASSDWDAESFLVYETQGARFELFFHL